MIHAGVTDRRSWLTAASLWLGIFCAGCGNRGTPTYPISGRISFDGQPVAAGDVLFVPADPKHGPNAGKIVDGQFHFRAIAGEHRVEIRALRPIPGVAAVLGEFPQENYLPTKYHAGSQLGAKVTSEGPNDYQFDLTSAP